MIRRRELLTLVSILVWLPLLNGCVAPRSARPSHPRKIAWLADCPDIYVMVRQRKSIYVNGRGFTTDNTIPGIDTCIGRALERHLQTALPDKNVHYVGLSIGLLGGWPESTALCDLTYCLTVRGDQLGVQERLPFFSRMPPDPLNVPSRTKHWWRARPGDKARFYICDEWEYTIDACQFEYDIKFTGGDSRTLRFALYFRHDQAELESAIAQWADQRGADLAQQVAEALKSCARD